MLEKLSGDKIQDEYSENIRKLGILSEYLHDRNYEGMLSLGLRHMTMVRVDDVPYELIAADIAEYCTYEVKCRYPDKMLRLAYEMYAGGLTAEYCKLMKEIKDMIKSPDLPQNQRNKLTGEWIIVSTLPDIRNINIVRERFAEAAKLMEGRSDVVDAADSVTFGMHGLLGVYLMEPGKADDLIPSICSVADLYSSFTGEQLIGMDVLYKACLAYYRGNVDEAKILAYKAIYMLETTKQDVLQISAGELLAQIATLQGDVKCFTEAVNYMDLSAKRSVNRIPCQKLVELIRCGLLNALGAYKETPSWLKTFSFATCSYGSGPFIEKHNSGNINFAPVSFGVACWYHTQYLFLSCQYERALAASDIMLQLLIKNKSIVLELFFSMISASCYKKLGEHEKALAVVNHAVERALPDRLFMILSLFDKELDGLVESSIKKIYINSDSSIRKLNSCFITGANILSKKYVEQELPETLTKREQEVARLALQGMRNIDIAKSLCISQNTVKAHLKSIFEKLDIDKRSKLHEKLK